LNLELKNASSKIASLRSVHDDMSAKPCDNHKMIMVNHADLWLMHFHVTSLLDSAKLELGELTTRSKLLTACTSCPLLRSDLEVCAVEIKDLKHQIAHSSRYSVYPLCVKRVSLSRVSFFMLPKRTPSLNRRLLI
jgi:hypothetical protein